MGAFAKVRQFRGAVQRLDRPVVPLGGAGAAIAGMLRRVGGDQIRGARLDHGLLLNNSAGMVNQGTIIADGPGTMTVRPNALGLDNQGTMRADAEVEVTLIDGYRPGVGEFFDVITGHTITSHNVNWVFTNTIGREFDAAQLTLFDPASGFNRDVWRVTVTAIPEPGFGGLLALAVLAGLARRRRRGPLTDY